MKGLEKITERIRADAQSEIRAICAEGDARAAEVTASYQAQAQQLISQESERTAQAVETLLQRGERLHFHGTNRSDYFFLSDSIIWIEATAGGKHSLLHTAEGEIEVMRNVAALQKDCGHLFLRCHQSYLVNPHYVRKLCRFRLSLTDGTELPIPEKKYTAFRDAIRQVLKH